MQTARTLPENIEHTSKIGIHYFGCKANFKYFVAISEFLNFITLQHRAMTTQIQTKARKTGSTGLKP